MLLDEFATERDDRNNLVKAIVKIRDAVPRHTLHVCMTARKGSIDAVSLEPYLKIPVRPSQADIRKYAETRIDGSGKLCRWAPDNSTRRKTIITSIVKKSKLIFKLASLQMDLLCKQVSFLDFERTLAELLSEIKAHFQDALARIDRKPEYRDWVNRLFLWILYANPPMQLNALSQALAMEIDLPYDTPVSKLEVDLSTLIVMSEGFVVSSGTRLSFNHETIDSFLRKSRSWFGVNGSELITETSLSYLCLESVFENVLNDWDPPSILQPTSPFYDWLQRFNKLSDYGSETHSAGTQKRMSASLRYLKDRFADYWDPEFHPILMYCHLGFTELVRELLQNCSANKACEGRSLLRISIAHGEARVVALLLSRPELDVNAKDERCFTALHHASHSSDTADVDRNWTYIIELLLEHENIDANAIDSRGYTALHCALQERYRVWRDGSLDLISAL